MSNKVKGILTPIGLVIVMFIVAIIVGFLMGRSTDGWAAIGAILMVFFATGFLLVVLFIIGFILYRKKQSEYGYGIIISIGYMAIIGFAFSLISYVYNMLI